MAGLDAVVAALRRHGGGRFRPSASPPESWTRSLAPIQPLAERTRAWRELTGQTIDTIEGNIAAPGVLAGIVRDLRPNAVVHMAGQPSRRWAEAHVEQAVETVTVAVVGAMRLVWALRDHAPDAHLVRLGTTGEYGRPNIEIAEGALDVRHRGRRDRLPMPLLPGSVYDLAKAHESSTVQTAARLFGLRVTDLRQGAVYGAETPETVRDDRLATRLDYDGTFGTALNRFCVQAACELPLTVTGDPSRAFPIVDIRDSVRAIELLTERPPPAGAPRTCNLFTEIRSARELADMVAARAATAGLITEVVDCSGPVPRQPAQPFRAAAHALAALGFRRTPLTADVIDSLVALAMRHRSSAEVEHLATSHAMAAADAR